MYVLSRFSMTNHDCIPNTTSTISSDNQFTLAVRSTIPVPEGTELTTSYLPFYSFSPWREERLLRGWGFECRCRRCLAKDVGSNCGAVKCSDCDKGFLLPSPHSRRWECGVCGGGRYPAWVKIRLNQAERIMSSAFGPMFTAVVRLDKVRR